MRIFVCTIGITLSLLAQTNVPKIWDEKALEDWATPIAALGVRPARSHPRNTTPPLPRTSKLILFIARTASRRAIGNGFKSKSHSHWWMPRKSALAKTSSRLVKLLSMNCPGCQLRLT
jgi:hypothetical protein